jgi:hypothetical protein
MSQHQTVQAQAAPEQQQQQQQEQQTVQPVGIREQLEATTRVVGVAHGAQLDEALGSVRWERRGPLRRLVRLPQS